MACGMDFDRPKIDGLPHPVRPYLVHSNNKTMGDKLAFLIIDLSTMPYRCYVK